MADCDDVDVGRECIIKGVCIYMGENPENLVHDYAGMDGDAFNAAIEKTGFIKENEASEESEDIGVVLEGIRLLRDLDNISLAVAMLFGLMYALNISYPADLRYTFEVVQKILALKNRLFQ